MKRRWKRCLAGAMLAAMLVVGTACSVEETTGTSNEGELEMTEMVRDALTLAGADMEQFNEDEPKASEQRLMEAAAWLEKTLARKYPGTAFQMTACVRRGLNQEYDQFTLEPEGRPEESFTARVWSEEDGFRCTDSYYGVAKTADYEAWLKEKLSAAEPDARIFSTIDFQFSEECGADMPIGEGARQPEFFAYTWILLADNGGAFAERTAALWKIMEDENLSGDFAVYLMAEDPGEMSKEEAFRLIPSHSAAQPVYSDMDRLIRR